MRPVRDVCSSRVGAGDDAWFATGSSAVGSGVTESRVARVGDCGSEPVGFAARVSVTVGAAVGSTDAVSTSEATGACSTSGASTVGIADKGADSRWASSTRSGVSAKGVGSVSVCECSSTSAGNSAR